MNKMNKCEYQTEYCGVVSCSEGSVFTLKFQVVLNILF
jgi:hypothetical protein